MKRLLTFIMVLMCSAAVLLAGVRGENRQEIYPVDSDVYEAIRDLYISEGLALPSTTGPWNAAELDLMLNRLSPEEMSVESRAIYDWVSNEISHDARIETDGDFGLDIGLRATAMMYAHTDSEHFSSLDSFGGRGDIREQLPMLQIPLETWIGSHVYGYSSFDIGISRTFINGLEKSPLFTNLFMVPPSTMADLNLNFPSRAVGSFGGENWNVAIGRDRMKWGPGESGNLIIGDQLPYHDNARFTAFSNRFKYTFSMSSFIHPKNYMKPGTAGKDWFEPLYDMRPERTGLSMLISHRLEWRIIDRINMALTESIRYQSSDGSIDWMVLSPTAVFHNYYIRGNANSIISLEMDFTPMKYLNIYGEMAIDEFKLPGEFDKGKPGPPTAIGFILGAKTSVPIGQGMLTAHLEGAYTDPYLYLRDEGASYGSDSYGINFIAAMSEWVSADGKPNYTQEFIGYRYGNDSVVAELGVGYKVYGKWFVDGRYTYIADGCFDENTRWARAVEKSDEDPSAPSTDHPAQGSFDRNSNWEDRDAVQHWNVLSITGGVTLLENLDIWGELNYINIQNFGNVSGQTASDLQFVLGVSYYI